VSGSEALRSPPIDLARSDPTRRGFVSDYLRIGPIQVALRKDVTVVTPEEVRALSVIVNLPEAGALFGLGRDASFMLADSGDFPTPVLRLGRRRVVTRAAILAALGIPDVPSKPLALGVSPQVSDGASDSLSVGWNGGEAA